MPHEQRPFEDEAIAMAGTCKSVEETFYREELQQLDVGGRSGPLRF
jgi:hypothetical protein